MCSGDFSLRFPAGGGMHSFEMTSDDCAITFRYAVITRKCLHAVAVRINNATFGVLLQWRIKNSG